ncbi:hypothetical protein SAMN05192543_102247 [Paraburkholderia megapolitana]|uniref:Uncharacterized protein n=1 Tax=Paraburkholderia megapolitana TaxID=420953 RepID=A0A1I3G1Y3_9BURK|nr:hypothetical protein SAMN05192543_102247 [Paraburkholderia megapolitana]
MNRSTRVKIKRQPRSHVKKTLLEFLKSPAFHFTGLAQGIKQDRFRIHDTFQLPHRGNRLQSTNVPTISRHPLYGIVVSKQPRLQHRYRDYRYYPFGRYYPFNAGPNLLLSHVGTCVISISMYENDVYVRIKLQQYRQFLPDSSSDAAPQNTEVGRLSARLRKTFANKYGLDMLDQPQVRRAFPGQNKAYLHFIFTQPHSSKSIPI